MPRRARPGARPPVIAPSTAAPSTAAPSTAAPSTAALVLGLALVAGCSPEVPPAAGIARPTSPGADAPAPSVLSAAPARVDVTVGGRLRLSLEVADTEAERERGLMGRRSVPAGGGMIFLFGSKTTTAFYMYRTLVPLSIAFVRAGRVVTVREMEPCPAVDPRGCPLYRAGSPYTSAIEARGGTFTAAGTRPGDPVIIRQR